MSQNLDSMRKSLFGAKDGRIACDAINSLTKLADKGTNDAKKLLASYMYEGAIAHMRKHACACLAEVVTMADTECVALFRAGLGDQNLQYWSVLGYINSAGRAAYGEILRIAEDESIEMAVRSHAVKCLARVSKQPFDRQLPSDPSRWKREDLRLAEIRSWKCDGYPDGHGFQEPKRHTALDEPKAAFEKIVSQLDKKLEKKRKMRQDLAEPTNWLTVASIEDIERIKSRWKLPSVYLDFLTRFSPIKVTVDSRTFYNGGLQLFGASELIRAQNGYSFNPVENQPIKDWPADLVVIASHAGDPFVLDLSESDGDDAPVSTAEHGAGTWEFGRHADSFTKFLRTFVK